MESALKDGETGGKYKCDICDFKSCKISGITIHRKDAHSSAGDKLSKKQNEKNIEIINDSESPKSSGDEKQRRFDKLIEDIKDAIAGKKNAFIK